MPSPLFCWHKWGKWGKPRNGKKNRTCSKCRCRQTKNSSWSDQLFCWHKWHRTRKNPVIRCVRCAKIKAVKK